MEGVWVDVCEEDELGEDNVYVLDEGEVRYEERDRVEFVSSFVMSDGRRRGSGETEEAFEERKRRVRNMRARRYRERKRVR